MTPKILLGPPQYERIMADCVVKLKNAGFAVVPSLGDRLMDHQHLAEHANECVGVIAGPEPWSASELELLPNLKVIAKCGAGVDNIDLTAARERGIKVANSPGMNSNAVAEFCVGLLLSIMRGIHIAHGAMQAGQRPLISGSELTGRTVGVVGWGNIGKLVAKRLSGFDVRVLYFDPFVPDAGPLAQRMESLEELVSNSDVVSLHMPATPETIDLVDEHLLQHFRNGSYLINAARGAIVDEQALLAAIESGKLAGAALDVQKDESVGAASQLRGHPRVLLTPHLGAETLEAYDRVGAVNAEDIIQLLRGEQSPRQLV